MFCHECKNRMTYWVAWSSAHHVRALYFCDNDCLMEWLKAQRERAIQDTLRGTML